MATKKKATRKVAKKVAKKVVGPSEKQLANRKDWLKALRSGKYQQTTGMLCRVKDGVSVGYCCLGVAAEIAGILKEPYSEWSTARSSKAFKNDGGSGGSGSLSTKWMSRHYGVTRNDAEAIHASGVKANDSHGKNFKEIATMMSGLFRKADKERARV